MINKIKDKIISGEKINYSEALSLADAPINQLIKAADEIRKHFCSNIFDVCSIINAKSGKCSENCKFCAQSAHYQTNINEYPLLDKDTIVKNALCKKCFIYGRKRCAAFFYCYFRQSIDR